MKPLLYPQEAQEAEQQVTREWRKTSDRVDKIAVLQHSLGLALTPMFQAWQNRDFATAFALMDASYQEQLADHTDKEPAFGLLTKERKSKGVKIRRIQIVNQDLTPDTRTYLGFLAQYFADFNAHDGEKIYFLPRALCKANAVALPLRDTALFDLKRAVVTRYGEQSIAERRFYDAGNNEDASFVARRARAAKHIEPLLRPEFRLTPTPPNGPRLWLERPDMDGIQQLIA